LKDAVVSGTIFARRGNTRFVEALNDVSFHVPQGATLGIIGRNGSGKSTLMRILAGIMSPDSGRVELSGSIAPLLGLGVGFHPDLTGRENAKINGLILGLHPAEIELRMDSIMEFSELGEFFDTPVRMYSSGMYMRLAYAVAISVDPDILLLDEVFAVGDAAFNEKCRAHMRKFREAGKTIVIVSHDLSVIESFCDMALWLEKGTVQAIDHPKNVVPLYRAANT
jgi:ABC-type polysaccharide/polyol phosphate transport system ATPase subunit